MRDLTSAEADHLVAHLLAWGRATIVPKSDSRFMRAVGRLLQLLGYLPADVFRRNFTTTIGRTLYTSDGYPSLPPWARVIVICHELVHVGQYDAGGLVWALGYLTRSASRAAAELPAYGVGQELEWWRFRRLPDPDELAARLESYGCSPGDRRVMAQSLRMRAAAVERGALLTGPAREAIAWMERETPEIRA